MNILIHNEKTPNLRSFLFFFNIYSKRFLDLPLMFTVSETEINPSCPKVESENRIMGEFRIKKIQEDEALPSLEEISEANFASSAKKRSTQLFLPPIKSIDRIPKNSSLGPIIASSNQIRNNRKSNFFEAVSTQEKVKKKTFYDVITSFYLTKKFILVLQRLTTFSKPKYMNEAQFNLIGDPSFYYPAYIEMLERGGWTKSFNKRATSMGNTIMRMMTLQTTKIKTKFLKKLSFLKIKIPIFHPFAVFVIIWDVVNLFLFSFLFMSAPINLSFRVSLYDSTATTNQQISKYLIIFFYVGDIFMSCITGHYKKGSLILERKKIVAKYFKRLFWLDLLSLLLVSLKLLGLNIVSENTSNIIFLMYFVKFSKVRKILQKIEELLVVDQNYFNLYSLFLLLIRLVVVAHIAACIWHYLAYRIENNDTLTWLTAKSLQNEDWNIRYLYSFYYILITMNTVGYGDITPQNSTEVLFCVLFVFVACIMFGYCINCVGAIFQDFYKRESEFKRDLFIMNDFMKSQNIPKELQIRIRKYLEHLWKEEKIHNIEMAKGVLNKLSDSLKFELLLEVNAPIIKKIDLLCQNFSEKTLREVIKLMKEERYTPGDIIFNQGDYENKDLFLIKKGCVQIFLENELQEDAEPKVLKELKAGQLFGEIAFFSDCSRTASAKSKEFTTLIRINQSKFISLVEQCDLDHEKYNQIRDSIRLYQNYEALHLNCYSCNTRGHIVSECPKLHRIFFKDLCIRKYNFSSNQERAKFSRERKKNKVNLIFDPKKDFFTRQFFSCDNLSYCDLDSKGSESEIEGESGTGIGSGLVSPGLKESPPKFGSGPASPGLKENPHKNKNNLPEIQEINSLDVIPQIIENNNEANNNIKSNNMTSSIMSFNRKQTQKKKSKTIHFMDDEKNEMPVRSFEKTNTMPTLQNAAMYNNTEKSSEFFMNLDSMKNFMKYFPHNNIALAINEANRRIYNNLKKKKKAHLFERMFIKDTMDHSEKSSYGRQTTKMLKDSGSPSKKNVLRKKSVNVQTWKQALESAQMGKQKKDENNNRFKFLKKILSYFCFWFK